MKNMSKRERVQAALAGEEVDQLPCSFWTHFPVVDLDPDAIALESVKFARRLDLDFIKTMPNGLFSVEDWGVRGDYSQVASGGVAKATYVIETVEDWKRIEPLDVHAGALGRELTHFKKLVELTKGEIPVLATAFSPLTIARKLAGERYRRDMQTHPALVRNALAAIATSMASFVREAVRMGCAGVFLASQESNSVALTEDEYEEFGVPFDHAALSGARDGWFNVLHMHEQNIMFDRLKTYPVHALNWHIGEAAPSLEHYVAGKNAKPIVGGLRRHAITCGNFAEITQDIASAIAATGGKKLLITPGCVIRHPVDVDLLSRVTDYIRNADLRADGVRQSGSAKTPDLVP